MKRTLIVLVAVVVIGCGESPDQRLQDLAQQSLAQQARQNEQLGRQSQRIADTAQQLVAADAQARRELVASLTRLQGQLQAERAEFDRQRDVLEQERRELAGQRVREPIVAQAIGALGVTLACLLPLLLAGYVLHTVNRQSPGDDAEQVSQLLIGELVEPASILLAGPSGLPRLEARPPDNPAHRPIT